MPTRRALLGVAHNIAHHSGSGLSYLSPHLAAALRAANRDTTTIDLLETSPYPSISVHLEPLHRALETLHTTAVAILDQCGFGLSDVAGIKLHATPAPWDPAGYTLHTRVVITDADGREYDSGWLG